MQLPALLELMREYDVQKYYLSHLNYSGRGKRSSKIDAHWDAMNQIFDRAWDDVQQGIETDFVSGNNDADAILLLQWAERNVPQHYAQMEQMLRAWGGNASGAGVANIDNLGDVHPDTYWQQHTLGNVRTQSFSDIWLNNPDPLLLQLRQHPRQVKGRCGECQWLSICNGNTCYLSDEEIGVAVLPEIKCVAL